MVSKWIIILRMWCSIIYFIIVFLCKYKQFIVLGFIFLPGVLSSTVVVFLDIYYFMIYFFEVCCNVLYFSLYLPQNVFNANIKYLQYMVWVPVPKHLNIFCIGIWKITTVAIIIPFWKKLPVLEKNYKTGCIYTGSTYCKYQFTYLAI